MFHKIAKFIYFKMMGWQLEGQFPEIDKCVIIVVPHTHWLDFPLGLLIRKVLDQEINYIGKKSLFKPPFGWFFRWTGGAPIDRSTTQNSVEAVVEVFKNRKIFRFALAPEGTRNKVKALKTGFYYIAKAAKVPIIMVAFNFREKKISIAESFYATEDINKDFRKIRTFFKDVKGKIPENSFGL
ncbi:1-acyl-sn-glycerol-3-phosphate acyltransferase [Croceitalea rosinachiae]|uniref:1-acyl-sn-glycerol-3-phosphate acyltransferase n=1 Tax=Croceitalea rosinachiae TaxID=3075596 RepID=A0ABU3AHW2_9FLAO|nr:1-acyl-sn-glycerol-3-phosphate acyltransferase [Croceitalea sp. F388]MDT0608491.1 1-acyl-sn-glycerol-3-phosphate acyltransferase [Croceitalea sp. F388]